MSMQFLKRNNTEILTVRQSCGHFAKLGQVSESSPAAGVVSGRSYQLETIHQAKNAAASFQIPTDTSILEPWTHESCIMPKVGNGA